MVICRLPWQTENQLILVVVVGQNHPNAAILHDLAQANDDFIPVPQSPVLDNSAPTMANSLVFVPSNTAMNYETNTFADSSEYYPNIYGDDDMSSSIAALQGLIDKLIQCP